MLAYRLIGLSADAGVWAYRLIGWCSLISSSAYRLKLAYRLFLRFRAHHEEEEFRLKSLGGRERGEVWGVRGEVWGVWCEVWGVKCEVKGQGWEKLKNLSFSQPVSRPSNEINQHDRVEKSWEISTFLNLSLFRVSCEVWGVKCEVWGVGIEK